MAKSLLLSVLVDVLGKYVEGLTSENLKLGVFSGKIEFHNLNLKDSALDELNLPIQVKKGSLKHLRVKVPWTQLESKPVEIAIDGVYLLAAPLDLSQCTPDVSRKMVLALKQRKLKEVEDAILLALNKKKEDAAQSASYLQQLGTCIADNLEVSLTNVHIRYEDANSDPGKVFCFGVTLDEVSLTTSDESWTAKFVKRDAAKRAETAIRKIGKLNNCGVYWNSDAQPFVSMGLQEWEQVMQALIYKSPNGCPGSERVFEETQFVLPPPNSLTVKITHREQCSESVPNVDIVVEISHLPFRVDKDQFRQFMVMLKSFGDLDRKRQMALYRPAIRPKRGVSAADWWHYAFRLVTGKDHSFANKVISMSECVKAKEKYIQYARQNCVGMVSAQTKGAAFKPLFEEEMRRIEEKLPLVVLIFFREEAARAAVSDLQLQQLQVPQVKAAGATVAKPNPSKPAVEKVEKPAPEKKEKKGFFSDWFSSSKKPESPVPTESSSVVLTTTAPGVKSAKDEEEEDLALMQDIQNKIQKLSEQSSAAIEQMFSFRLSVSSSATLELTYNQSSIARLQMSMGFDMEMRYSNMLLRFDLNDFTVADSCSSSPYNPDLLRMAAVEDAVSLSKSPQSIVNKRDQRSQFELTFAIEKDKSVLKIRALPLLITWNKHCIQQLLAFVITAIADDSLIGSNQMLRNSMERFAAEAAMQKSRFLMEIDIDAPKVIIPEDQGFSERCTIFDAGTLHLDGELDSEGMCWNIALQNINIAMPFSRHDASHASSQELYLVKPFDVRLTVDNRDRSRSDLTVSSHVLPDIEARFTAQRIVRLVQAVAEVISSVDTSKVESRTSRARAARRSSMINAAPKPTDTLSFATTPTAIDKDRVNVLVEVLLPRLLLRLQITEKHFTELHFSGMKCFVSQRYFDQSVLFTLDSLLLTDSQRERGFEAVILARADPSRNAVSSLFSFTLNNFTSKSSPRYNGHAMEFDMRLSVVDLFVDDRTTLNYKVLVDQLLSAYKLYFRGIADESAASTKAAISSGGTVNTSMSAYIDTASISMKKANSSAVTKSNNKGSNDLGGIALTLTMERVSLHMLDTNAALRTSPDVRTEIAFSIHVNMLRFSLKMEEFFSGSASLHSIDLVDVRSSTETHKFRKLLSSDIYKYQDPENMDVDAEHIAMPATDDMLRVEITQRSASSTEVSLTVGHVTVLIAVDVLLDLVSMLLANVNSLLEVVNAFSMDARSREVIDNFSSSTAEEQSSSGVLQQQPSSAGENAESSQETLVLIKVANPHLLLIEDPRTIVSRAVTNRCEVNFLFQRIVKDSSQEIVENMSIDIKNSEIFVVGDLSSRDSVRRIVDPMDFEFSFSNRSERNIPLKKVISLSSSSVIAIRVSLNDILLANSIAARFGERLIVSETNVESDGSAKEKVRDTPSTAQNSNNGSNLDVSALEILSSIHSVKIVLINDCDGLNSPLLRLEAADAIFNASGPTIQLVGDASIQLRVDYYNVSLNVWESVLELFRPTVNLTKDSHGLEVTLSVANSLQVNVTGTLLKCIMNAVHLVSSAGQDKKTKKAIKMYHSGSTTLQICNQLGVDVQLVSTDRENERSSPLLLADSEIHFIPESGLSLDCSSYSDSWSSSQRVRPRTFALYFQGELEGKISSLRQLSSAASKKSRMYQLQPRQSALSPSVTTPLTATAPVTVSVYQYQRYNIASQRWETPFQVNDPYEFADGLRQGNTPPSQFTLPKQWRWIESDWQIDKTGKHEKLVDEEGWEYASDFREFTLTSARRNKRTTDYVRRRRLIRTRVFRLEQHESLDSIIPSAKLVWDVVTLPDESKEIFLRTPKCISNELPVDLEVGMGSSYRGPSAPMTSIIVKQGSKTCVPLKSINEFFVRVRPVATDGEAFTWSEEIPVVLMDPAALLSLSDKHATCFSAKNKPHAIGIFANTRENCLFLTFHAQVHVTNRLPCAFSLGFRTLAGTMEAMSFPPGDSRKLMNMNFNAGQELDLIVHLGTFSCAVRQKTPSLTGEIEDEIELKDEKSPRSLLCTLRLSLSTKNALTISIFSRTLLFDRSGLRISGLCDDRGFCMETPTFCTEEMLSSRGVSSLSSSDYWIYGVNGMALFQTPSKKFNLLVNRGRAGLADELDLESLSTSKVKLQEIFDPINNTLYHLAVQLRPFPAAPDVSSVLTVMPAFHLVNAMSDKEFFVMQANGDSAPISVRANAAQPWHGSGRCAADSSLLFFRTSHSDWSLCTVNINDIGTSVLALPRKVSGGPEGKDPVILNVDVRFSHADDPSYITVTVWESRIWKDPSTQKVQRLGTITFSVRNDADCAVVVRQHGVDVLEALRRNGRIANETESSKFELVVPAHQWSAYGWCDLELDAKLEVFVTDASRSKLGRATVVDSNKVGSAAMLGDNNVVHVKAGLHGNFLHIESVSQSLKAKPSVTAAAQAGSDAGSEAEDSLADKESLRANDVSLRLQLSSISVSLVADRPRRREFLAAYLDNVQFCLKHVQQSEYEDSSTALSFEVCAAQIDNYSESALYPVLLSTSPSSSSSSAPLSLCPTVSFEQPSSSTEPSFLEFRLILESPREQSVSITKYVAFRMLETHVWVDSATILLYMSDVHRDLLEGASQIDTDEKDAVDLADSFNRALVKISNSPAMDVKKQYDLAQGDKMFFQTLDIHPMKVVVNFTPSHYPRDTTELPPQLRWMTKIETVSAVEDFPVRINSFKARDAMESIPTLIDRIVRKISSDMLKNLLGLTGNLIGSLSALGKPAGLYKKIGSGVEDFFYEPYQGLMKSPASFVKGLGRGTTQLIKGVGGGVVGSTATIVGSASGGVANVARSVVALTGDSKFARRQEEKRREMKFNNSGALAGFRAAGESVFSGISSGITGLVTSPIEETKKSGAMGFFVGVGKGIVGAAVKPVMGVTEGISSVATGINQQFASSAALTRRRPARAFLRPEVDSLDFVLVPLDLYAALAQEFVNKYAFKKNITDHFLLAVPLGFSPQGLKEDELCGLVLSRKFVFALSKTASRLWNLAVADISHVALVLHNHQYALQFVEYTQGKVAEAPKISPFANQRMAVSAYDQFAQYRSIFGNPSMMESSELALAAMGSEKEIVQSQSLSQSQSQSSSHGNSPVPSRNESFSSSHTHREATLVSPVNRMHSLREYTFGTANGKRHENSRFTDTQFYAAAKAYFAKIHIALPVCDQKRADYHKYLDELLWRAISDWIYNHDTLFNPSRCCACLVINHAKSAVQITETKLKEGVRVVTFGVGDSFDDHANVLKPDGGAAVIFAYGARPSPFSKEHTKFEITTNAFHALVSTRENSSNMNASLGFNALFLEKTRTDWWAKFVIAVC